MAKIDDNIYFYQSRKYRNCVGCFEIILPTVSTHDFFKVTQIETALSKILYEKGFEIIGLYLREKKNGESDIQVLSYEVNVLKKLEIPLDDYQLYAEPYFQYQNNENSKVINEFNINVINELKKFIKESEGYELRRL
ncbi:hypothetical protein [Lactococcus lactis]|uniref:hypothetical protein n=1 Tax=Lactococcus lactis TaxID=1358 RepID=UPI0022E76B9D|nr:hypothetical protein [Lactococcus lactis]